MNKMEYKIIRDNVHGYIKIPVDFVRLFIDTNIFQRLRNIEQTGMRMLYPSARHDRFIHSLGTFHLGSKAFDNFLENVKSNQSTLKHFNVFPEEENDIFWRKCGYLFKIACLLHDCGHSPFSHTLEFLYEAPCFNRKTLKQKLKSCLASSEFLADFVNQGKEHEKMSSLVVILEYGEKIEEFLEKFELKTSADPNDIEFVVRMILGCLYKKDTKANRIKNCLISLLNSNSIDVDKLDYIVRDSKLSGIDNMSVDVDRLLSSIVLIEKTIFKDVKVYNPSVSTNIIDGTLVSKEKNKAKVNGQLSGQANIHNFDGEISGVVDIFGHLRIKNEQKFNDSKGNILKVGSSSYSHTNTIHSTANMVDVEILATTEKPLGISGTQMSINKGFNGKLNLSADSFELGSVYINGEIDGFLSGELLGDYSHLGGTLTCELGWHKSSLSVIQNVLVARNYEYQWIYAHHKVVYYSNFLIIELLRSCLKYLIDKESSSGMSLDNVLSSLFSWEYMVKDDNGQYNSYEFSNALFMQLTDSDLMFIFKKCYLLCIKNNEINTECFKLLSEYYSRVYRRSLWKSYAEFGIFFNNFSDDEKRRLSDLFLDNSKTKVNGQYGFFNDEWQNALKQFGLNRVAWVNANSNLKGLNADNTYISFKDSVLNYKTVSLSQEVKVEQKSDWVYIYYEEIDGMTVDFDKIKAYIKEKLSSSK